MILRLFRFAAIALIVAGAVDPSWTVRREAPVPVDLRSASEAVRKRLSDALGDRVAFDSTSPPREIVLAAAATSARLLPVEDIEDVPVSTIALTSPHASRIRIIHTNEPAPVPVGWSTTIKATIEAAGVRGATSRVVLEQAGAEIAAVDHVWTRDEERFEAAFPYTPALEGSTRLTVRVMASDAAADVRVAGIGRRFRILAYEPRPTWAVGFLRRVLEQDPVFDVSSSVRASKIDSTSAGQPPTALTADALSPFDVVLVGAPEDLRSSEVEALASFTRARGGTVVLLPDRRPSRAYLSLVPGQRFDEVLVEEPLELSAISGASLRASELAIPSDASGGDALATVNQGKGPKPVVVSWPMGEGTVVFSGALDAWRYRAAPGDGFARFWRTRVAEAALATPPRISVSVTPAIAAPSEDVDVRVKLRSTELVRQAGRIAVPKVRAVLVGEKTEETIRLWPTAEPGAFAGVVKAPPSGDYNLHVTSDSGGAGDDVLSVVADARHADVSPRDGRESLRLVSAATAGVAVDETDLDPLERHLLSLSRSSVLETVRPTRSPWFAGSVIALLCAEWGLRRRRGHL